MNLTTRLRMDLDAYAPTLMSQAADEIDRLNAECDRLAQRNTMLVNELSDRGRQFTPGQLKRINAIAAELYKGEG